MKDSIASINPTYIDFNKIQPESIIFNNFIEFNPNDPKYTEMKSTT